MRSRTRWGDAVRVVRAPCMGRCEEAPVAEVGHRHVTTATVESILTCVEGADHSPVNPPYVDFDAYVAGGGYTVLKECLFGARTVDHVIAGTGGERAQGQGRRGLSHRAQVALRPCRGRSPADGCERRRRRARHNQGPGLHGAGPAPLPRRLVDRRLGRRGRRVLRLPA